MTDVNVLHPQYLLTATHIMAEINFQLKRRSALEAHAHIWSNDPYYFNVIILCDIYIYKYIMFASYVIIFALSSLYIKFNKNNFFFKIIINILFYLLFAAFHFLNLMSFKIKKSILGINLLISLRNIFIFLRPFIYRLFLKVICCNITNSTIR